MLLKLVMHQRVPDDLAPENRTSYNVRKEKEKD